MHALPGLRTFFNDLVKVAPRLSAAERQGILLAVALRTALIMAVLAYLSVDVAMRTGNFTGIFFGFALLAVGGAQYALIRTGRERPWHRAGFVTIDVAAVVLGAAFIPLTAAGDVPQHFVFHVYSLAYLLIILAVTCLSLSPWLVLWAGAMCALGIWVLFAIVTWNMPDFVSWSDLPPNPRASEYLGVILDPTFVGTGSRIIETLLILGIALILAAAVQRARVVVRARASSERRQAELRSVFGQYVPDGVAEALLADRGALAPTERRASVLFVDIEGFTGLTERLPPERLVAVVNAFFDRMARIVGGHGGVVVSYVGDGLMAGYNVPLERPGFVREAVLTAQDMRRVLSSESFEGERLEARIGIATGSVAAGSFGGGGRLTYTLYGDTVNLAQRLEEANKELGTRILCCTETVAAVPEMDWSHLGEIAPRGRSARLPVASPAGGQQATNPAGTGLEGPLAVAATAPHSASPSKRAAA